MARNQSEEVEADYGSYSDDPVFEDLPASSTLKKVLGAISILVAAAFFMNTTLASNVSLNSGQSVEFGQGILQATACSGNTTLTIRPASVFTNTTGGGTYSLASIKVSNIPDSCIGSDFLLNAYGETSSAPLAIFNSSSTQAVIYNNAGTFEVGAGGTGLSVASSSGEFTVNFTVPVAQTSSISKITIQSTPHTNVACALGGTCALGDTGPGGGKVYFVAATPFSCGPTLGSTCRYLEVAPASWTAGDYYRVLWGAQRDVPTITNQATAVYTAAELGTGLRNTLAIISTMNTAPAQTNYAAALAQGYNGGGKSDWYLPTLSELNLLCQSNRGVTLNVTVACTGGDGTAQPSNKYWTSTEIDTGNAWAINSFNAVIAVTTKDYSPNNTAVRPIRAF